MKGILVFLLIGSSTAMAGSGPVVHGNRYVCHARSGSFGNKIHVTVNHVALMATWMEMEGRPRIRAAFDKTYHPAKNTSYVRYLAGSDPMSEDSTGYYVSRGMLRGTHTATLKIVMRAGGSWSEVYACDLAGSN